MNTPPLKEGLQKLANLSGLEEEIRKIKNSLDDIPANLKELGVKLQSLLKTSEEKKKLFHQLSEELSQTEKDLAESKELLKSREAKLYEIKTTKEYQAAQKEIASAKKINIEKEIKLPDLKQNTENLKNELTSLETEIQSIQSKIQEEESRIGNELESLRLQLEEKLTNKQKIFENLDKNLVNKYEKVASRKQPAMAVIRLGICQECNINIPSQLYMEIQKQNQIIHCPSCFRILYIPFE